MSMLRSEPLICLYHISERNQNFLGNAKLTISIRYPEKLKLNFSYVFLDLFIKSKPILP